MRKMKKAIVMLAAVLAVTAFGGCGRQFDASAYIKSLLDNSYKNDSTEFVKQDVGTAERASDLYEQGIDTELDSLISTFTTEIPDGLKEEFRGVLKDVFRSVRYTVGEAVEKEDSYEVEVKYQKMDVFAPAMENYYAALEKKVEEIAEQMQEGGEQPTEEELNEQRCAMLKDAIKDALQDVSYEDEASVKIHVNLVNDVWTPDEDDVYKLETLLLDYDAVAQGAEEEAGTE